MELHQVGLFIKQWEALNGYWIETLLLKTLFRQWTSCCHLLTQDVYDTQEDDFMRKEITGVVVVSAY